MALVRFQILTIKYRFVTSMALRYSLLLNFTTPNEADIAQFKRTRTLVESELEEERIQVQRSISSKNQIIIDNSAPVRKKTKIEEYQMYEQRLEDIKEDPQQISDNESSSRRSQSIKKSVKSKAPSSKSAAKSTKSTKTAKTEEQKYRSLCHLVGLCSIVAISSFQFGYSLSSVSTIPTPTLISEYHIPFSIGTTEGILNGIVPIGALFGSICNRFFLTKFTRKFSNHPVNLINIIGSILCCILTVETIIIGRFFVGFSCGLYTAIAPVYIRDLAPKTLRATLGTFPSLGRCIGIVICYALGIMCTYACPDVAWYIMFGFPALLSLLQSILLVLFVPESPLEMLHKNNMEELTKSLLVIYKEEYIQDAINDQTNLKLKNQRKDEPKVDQNTVDQLAPNRRRAFLMALHISFLRQMIGVNFLVVYAGQIMEPINATIAPFMPILINFIQLLCGFAATLYITKHFGRRTMLLFGASTLTVWNFALAATFYQSSDILIIVFLIMTMVSFGSTFSPVSWPYPTQIITPDLVPYSTFFNWLGCTIITVFPPIIIEKMPGNNAYPLFFFFGAYSFFSSIYIYFGAKEIKGLTYQQIIRIF